MTTRADNELLESGGMFYIGAEQGGKALTAVAPLTYKFPKNGNKKSDFQLFKGIKDKNGDLNWRLSNAPAKADRAANDLDNIISGTSDFKGSIGLANDNKNGVFMYSASAILDVTQSEGLKYVVDITPKIQQIDNDIRNQINNILFLKNNEKLRYKETKDFDKGICTFKITTAGDFVDIMSKMNDPYFDDIMQKTFEGAHVKQKSSKMDKVFTVTIKFSPADIWNKEDQLYRYLTTHPEDSTFSEKMRNELVDKRKLRSVNAGLKELAQNTTAAGVVNSSASATHYLFTSSQLGWANCDRFVEVPSKKVTLAVTNLAAPTTMSVIFKNIKTMVGSTYTINDKAGIGSCVSARLPEGEPISIVALQERDGIPYIAIMETKVSDTPIADLQFSLATPDKLRKIKEMLE